MQLTRSEVEQWSTDLVFARITVGLLLQHLAAIRVCDTVPEGEDPDGICSARQTELQL